MTINEARDIIDRMHGGGNSVKITAVCDLDRNTGGMPVRTTTFRLDLWCGKYHTGTEKGHRTLEALIEATRNEWMDPDSTAEATPEEAPRQQNTKESPNEE